MLKVVITTLLFISISANVLAKQNKLPLEYFSQLPSVQTPVISPNGNKIAVILNQEENTQVAIIDYDNPNNVSVILQLGAEKYRIDDIDWANDKRIIVTVSQPYFLNKYRLRTTHIYSASIDGSSVFELRKKTSRKQSAWDFYYASPHLLSLLEKESNHILVTMSDKRDGNYSSVFKVNVNNGEFEKYLPNAHRIVDWAVNRSGEVLLAIGVDRDFDKDISYIYTRKDSNADWELVKTYEAFQSETFSPQLYDPITNTIIVLSDHVANKNSDKKQALWKFDITSNKFTQLLGEAPNGYDVTGVITRLEGDYRKIIGYRYNDGFMKEVYFDRNNETLSEQIKKLFLKNGLQANLWHWDRAKNHYIVSTISDKKPTKYYLFDKSKKKLSPWYGQYPNLEKANLADVQPFDFTARDGMQLHGYLTLPIGVKNAPLVLFPHGGPLYRDSQYFDPFVQMFANRGFAVLQVNYRGSTGFGNNYETSGYLQWGKKMQTDLIDAVDWVKEKKLADTDNACIVGASYGGYAALVAGYQTPKKFKCIVSIAGISDLSSQINHWSKIGARSYVKNAVSSDRNEQNSLSPAFNAKAFEAPVLLIHGRVDTRVSYHQSEKMYDALKRAKKNVSYELFDHGTHHLNDAGNLKQAMKLTEAFLEKHLH